MARVLYAIQNGGFSGAIMPQNIVVGAQALAVAQFVATYAGRSAPKIPGVVPCEQVPIGSITGGARRVLRADRVARDGHREQHVDHARRPRSVRTGTRSARHPADPTRTGRGPRGAAPPGRGGGGRGRPGARARSALARDHDRARGAARRAEPRQQGPQGAADARGARAARRARRARPGAERRGDRGARRARRASWPRCRTCPPRTPPTRTRSCTRSGRPAPPARTTSSSRATGSTWSAGRGCQGRGSPTCAATS